MGTLLTVPLLLALVQKVVDSYNSTNPAQGAQGAPAVSVYTSVTPDRCVHGAAVGTAAAVAKSCQGPSVVGYSATPCPGLRVKTSTVLEEENPARLGQLLQKRTRARRC